MENETRTHWKLLTNPNYLGTYAIPPGEDLIAVIAYVAQEEVTGEKGKKEIETVAHFSDGNKPMILNKTNLKMIQKIYKTPYVEDWRGRAIQIYVDPTVKFGREVTGGLRIRNFIPKPQKITLKCTDCGQAITESYGKTSKQIALYTCQKYGKELCSACAEKLKAKLDAQTAPNPF